MGYYEYNKVENIKDKYRNPFSKKRSAKINKDKILLLIFLIIAVYWFHLLFFSPSFKITEVNIENLEYIDKFEITQIVENQFKKKILFVFPQDRHFFLNKKTIEDEIRRRFLIEDLQISKKGINGLNIKIKEKVSCITWISGDKYYYLDIQGNVKREVDALEVNRNYPIIYDANSKPVVISLGIQTKVIDEKYIRDAIKIADDIKNNTEIDVISYKYFDKGVIQELYAKVNKGYEIYFDLKNDIKVQLDNFYTVWQQEIKDKNESISYIDLRFGDRVYYK